MSKVDWIWLQFDILKIKPNIFNFLIIYINLIWSIMAMVNPMYTKVIPFFWGGGGVTNYSTTINMSDNSTVIFCNNLSKK